MRFIKELINKYFEENINDIIIKYFLPLRITRDFDKKGKPIIKGGMANFKKNDYKILSENETKDDNFKTPLFIKYIDKISRIEKQYLFRKAIDYENADLYELNINVINDCILIFDIDNDEIVNFTTENKNLWINENIPEKIRNLPYTLSRNKKLPHYWCIVKDIDKNIFINNVKILKDCLNFCKGDILTSHVWENANAEIYNYNGFIPTLDFEYIKYYIKNNFLNKFYVLNKINKTKNKIEDCSFIDTVIENDTDTDTDNDTDVDTDIEYKMLEINNLEKVKLLSQCMTDEWFSNYDNWINYAFAFKNIFDNNGRETWDNICKKFSKYNKEDNNDKWVNIKQRTKKQKNLGFGSFIYWAKECNINKYYELFPSNKSSIDWNRLTEAEYADMMYKLYFKDKLIFIGNQKIPKGYLYNNVYWNEIGSNMCQIKKCYFKKLYKFYKNNLDKIKNELNDEQYKILSIKIQDLDKKNIRDKIIGIIVDELWVIDKNIEWNKNKDLFVFENKIYDLQNDCFIDSKPEFYINKTCGYSYEDGDFIIEQKEIHDFLDSIIDNNNLYEEKQYLLKVMSSFLRQDNKEEKAYFWCGKGRNGKGTLTTLLNNILGEYWGELNIEYYTNYDKGSNTHQQNLYNCRYSRLINTSEISDENESGEPIKFISDKFKRITGGDTVQARECGSNDIAYFKAGKILIQTNVLPVFTKIDISIKERIDIQKFPYVFTNDDSLLINDPNTYKKRINTLKDKFFQTNYKNAFIKILFHYYKLYKSDGLITPNSIRQYTLSYFNNSNNIKNWFLSRFKYILYNNSNHIPKIEIRVLKEQYILEEGIPNKLSEIKFREELSKIDGFNIGGNFIKKNSNGFYELSHWIEIPIPS